MKFKTDAKWLEMKLALADDSRVGAGGTSLEHLAKILDQRAVTPATIAAAPTEFGKVVRFVRERKGLTRSTLASVSKVSEAEIERFETNPNPNPSPRALSYLADALELSDHKLQELVGWKKDRMAAAAAQQQTYKFAARSGEITSMSDDEYEAIRALVQVLSEKA